MSASPCPRQQVVSTSAHRRVGRARCRRANVSRYCLACAGPVYQPAKAPANAIVPQGPGGGVVPGRGLPKVGGGTLGGLVGASSLCVHVHAQPLRRAWPHCPMCGDRSWRGLGHIDLLPPGLPPQCRPIACCPSGGQGTCRKPQLPCTPAHMPPHLRRPTLPQALWLPRALWLSVWLGAVVCGMLGCAVHPHAPTRGVAAVVGPWPLWVPPWQGAWWHPPHRPQGACRVWRGPPPPAPRCQPPWAGPCPGALHTPPCPRPQCCHAQVHPHASATRHPPLVGPPFATTPSWWAPFVC